MLIEKLPMDLIVVIVCLVMAIAHSNREVHVKPQDGIISVMVSVVLGYLAAWGMKSYTALLNVAIVALSGAIAYMGTGILIAGSKVGTQILSKPNALLRAALPGFLSKLLPEDEPIDSTTVNKEQP